MTRAGRHNGMSGQKASWIHFAGLTSIVAVFLVLQRSATVTPADSGFLAQLSLGIKLLPSSIYPFLPILVGLSVGMPRVRRGLTRHAATMALLVTATMLLMDLTAPPASQLSLNRTTVGQSGTVTATRLLHLGPVNAIPTLISTIGESGTAIDEVLSNYPPDHPRLRMALSVNRAMLMTLPIVLAGIVLGMGAWMSGRVSFRQDRDERIARLALVWLVVPMAYWVVQVFAEDAFASVLVSGDSFLVLIVPYVPAFVLCALGWHSSRREEAGGISAPPPQPPEVD